LIIKGRKNFPGDEPPAPREAKPPQSALIKRNTGYPAPAATPLARKSALMKHGTYMSPEQHAAREQMLTDADEEDLPLEDLDDESDDPRPTHAAPEPVTAVQQRVLDEEMLEEAKRRADAIMRQAQMEAKKLLDESKIYCQNAFAEAERQGLEHGKQRGYTEFCAQVAEHMRLLRVTLAQLAGAKEHVLRSMQGEIAKMAMQIAKRITSTEVVVTPDIVQNQITMALEKVKDREHISVHVHPEDLEQARAHKDAFARVLEAPKSFEIVSNTKVDRGGCIIETNQGNVDARIETQLAALEIAFNEIERHQREEWEAAARAAREAMMPPEPAPPDLPAASHDMHGEMHAAPAQMHAPPDQMQMHAPPEGEGEPHA
jgi:flagellar biosynthesis/type III secretory pathway protein FliH